MTTQNRQKSNAKKINLKKSSPIRGGGTVVTLMFDLYYMNCLLEFEHPIYSGLVGVRKGFQ